MSKYVEEKCIYFQQFKFEKEHNWYKIDAK